MNFQFDNSLLTGIDFDCELVFMFLSNNFNVFSLFESDCLTKIIVVVRFVGIVIVNVASYWPSDSFYSVVFGVLVYSLFFCEFLMKDYNFIEKLVQIQLVSVLD